MSQSDEDGELTADGVKIPNLRLQQHDSTSNLTDIVMMEDNAAHNQASSRGFMPSLAHMMGYPTSFDDPSKDTNSFSARRSITRLGLRRKGSGAPQPVTSSAQGSSRRGPSDRGERSSAEVHFVLYRCVKWAAACLEHLSPVSGVWGSAGEILS